MKVWPARVAAVVVGVFGFLPLANWLPGNRSITWFDAALSEWVLGGAIVIGAGVVLAVLLRPYSLAWRARLAGILRFGADTPRSVAVATAMVASFLVYVLISTLTFDRRPLIIDEIVEVIQARIFASGRLWAPTPQYPEFTAILNVVNDGPKTYGHFPPGGPAILALGELVHAPWISGPVCAALSVLLMSWLLRAIEPRASVRVIALLLFAFAPFTAFMAGSHMNHVPSLTFLLLGMAGSVNALLSPTRRPGAAFAAGLVSASPRPSGHWMRLPSRCRPAAGMSFEP